MPYTGRELREAFHLQFLSRLLKLSDPRLYVLKGGANLRFFHASPRYSEGMDLDVLGGAVSTLRKNGYRILSDSAFRRSLAALGVVDVEVNDPERAKHTPTTQRFRARVVTVAGEALPTKVEFSRRRQGAASQSIVTGTVSPDRTGRYRQLAFQCQHYSGAAQAEQKLAALAGRSEPQVRDVFDLYVLWLGGQWDDTLGRSLSAATRERALDVLVSFSYADYADQVLDYLEPESRAEYEGVDRWNDLCAALMGLLDKGHA